MSTHTVPPPRTRHEGFSVHAVMHTWRALLRMLQRQPSPRQGRHRCPSVPPPAPGAALLQAGRQAAGHAQCQVPGHRHHGYLHIHCASHAAVPHYCCLEEQELIACLPGHCRGWWRAEALGQKPTKPRSCWRAGAGTQLDQRNQRAFGPIHTTQGGCDCSLWRNCSKTEKELLKLKTRARKTWGWEESMGMR